MGGRQVDALLCLPTSGGEEARGGRRPTEERRAEQVVPLRFSLQERPRARGAKSGRPRGLVPRDKSPGGCGAAGSLGAGRRSAEGSARVGIGARATAAGPAQGFIYKRALQSKFLSILTLLPPVVGPRPPPPQLAFSLSCFVCLELCNPCRDTIYGGTEFPAFVSYASPTTGAVSKAFPLPFKTALEGQGGGEREGEGTSCVLLLFAFERKRRRGSPAPPRPLPALAPLPPPRPAAAQWGNFQN